MKSAALIALLLSLLIIPVTAFAQAVPSPSPGTPGWPWWHSWNPYHSNYPHPNTNPYRRGADAATYGQVVSYIEVPPQRVVIDTYVPGPGSFPGTYEPQVMEVPGFIVTETTTGYLYPQRWVLEQTNVGVYQWRIASEEFQRK